MDIDIQSLVKMYHFPIFKDLPLIFNSTDQINQVMDTALRNYNQKTIPSNRIQKTMVLRQTEMGALLKCKAPQCNAYILFQKNPLTNIYSILKFQTQHQHRLKQSRRGPTPKIKNSQVQQCYDQLLLLNYKSRQIIQFIKTKFNISKPHFYGIKFCRSRRDNIKNLLLAISKYDHFFFQCKDMRQLVAHYKNEKFPDHITKERDIIILISKKMKQMYQGYHGQYVYFTIFPDIVLQNRVARTLSYDYLGVLYGQNADGTLNLLFGLVIIRKPIRLAYLYVMERMFNFLGKYPKVIITDYDQALAQAIKRLHDRSKNPQSLKHHIQTPTNFITATLQQQHNVSTQFLSILNSDLEGILRDPDLYSHKKRVAKVFEANKLNTPEVQIRIEDQLKKFITANSIINMPSVFIGLAMTPESAVTRLKSKILDFFKSPRTIILSIKAFFQIFKIYQVLRFLSPEQIESRINSPKQADTKSQKLHLLQLFSKQINPSTKIKPLIKALPQPALFYLYDHIQECLNGDIELIQENKNRYYYIIEETQDHYPYNIRKVVQMINGKKTQVWRCDCRLYFKSGLPCWHQIKVCLHQGSDISLQVNPYWITKSIPQIRRRPRVPHEHDIKNWNEPQQRKFIDDNEEEEANNMNQIQIKPESQNNNNYFTYDIKQDTKMNEGVNDIMQQLEVVNWQMNEINNEQDVKQLIKEEVGSIQPINTTIFDDLQTDKSLQNLVKMQEQTQQKALSLQKDMIFYQLDDQDANQLQRLNNMSLNASSLNGMTSNFNLAELQLNNQDYDYNSDGNHL